jgi:hypothetical protein
MGGQPYKMSTYVAGAKAALKHEGLTDSEVYDTLLSMGIPEYSVRHIGKEERNKSKDKGESD